MANGAGYSVVLCNTDESPDREHAVLATLRGRVDGLLLAPARDDAETVDSLDALGIPVVLVDRTLPDPGTTDSVLIDNAGGAAAAARHLIELGHRRLGLISGPRDTTPGGERYDGFIEACAEASADVEVVVELGDFRTESGYQAAMRLFGRADAPTAVLAANNLMTVGLLRALHDLGLRVPDVVSVIGFDDHVLADLLDPPLTVVDRATDTQGAVATRMLLARLADMANGDGRTVRLDTNLIVRSSTAQPLGQS